MTRTTAPASAPRAAAQPAPAAAPAAPPATQSAVKPLVDLNATPVPAQTATRPARTGTDETALEIGGGIIALLALGGGAYALARRRRRDEGFADDVYAPDYEAEPVTAATVPPSEHIVHQERPAIVAPSAFAWDNAPPTAKASDDGSDRRPGETWVERAYRGPSPANPSVSIRARLKRAAFFDKREREVTAGRAEPVETDAGLPEAMIEEQEAERERDIA